MGFGRYFFYDLKVIPQCRCYNLLMGCEIFIVESTAVSKTISVFIKGKSWDKHKAWSCDSVFFFSCRNELETADIISWCLSHGKHVAVPKVQGEIMHFFEITALSDCVPGAFGILSQQEKKKTESQLQAFACPRTCL